MSTNQQRQSIITKLSMSYNRGLSLEVDVKARRTVGINFPFVSSEAADERETRTVHADVQPISTRGQSNKQVIKQVYTFILLLFP